MDQINCDLNYGPYYSLASTWIRGAIASGLVYGAVITLSFFCVQLLWHTGFREQSIRGYLLTAYVAIMLLLSTLIFGSNMMKVSENIRLPSCMRLMYVPFVVNTLGRLGDVCYVISNWGADALLIWRCMVIYQGCRVPRWLVALVPTILFLGSTAMGIIFLTFNLNYYGQSIDAGSGGLVDLYYGNSSIQSVYSFITLGLNCLVTVMIVSRLAIYRTRVIQVLGKEYGSPYTGIIAMVIESQLLVVVFVTVMVFEMFRTGAFSETSLMLYQVVSQTQIFAPLLIIFRVAQGKAWSSNTCDRITTRNTHGKAHNKISTLDFSVTVASITQNTTIKSQEQDETKINDDIV